MTSPSLPVSVRWPLPGISVASVTRISPPTSVQARPGRDADLVGLLGHRVAEPRHAEVLGHLFGRDLFGEALALDDHLARHLAADRRDLALEIADARFARVALDDRLERLVRER